MTVDNSDKDEEASSIRLELVASSEADSVASVSDLMKFEHPAQNEGIRHQTGDSGL